MIYLMSPYTSPKLQLQEVRFALASLVAGELMQQFPYEWVFSPITQGHSVVPYLPPAVAKDHKFWMGQCRHALADADRVMLLPLPGWSRSAGISLELSWCVDWDKPVILLDFVDFFASKQAEIDEQFPQLGNYMNLCCQQADVLMRVSDVNIVQRYRLSTKSLIAHTDRREQE